MRFSHVSEAKDQAQSNLETLIGDYTELLERGIRLYQRGDPQAAVPPLRRALAALTLLSQPRASGRLDLMINRTLVRAAWRLALSHLRSGALAEARSKGQVALAAGRNLLETLPADAPERIEVTAEVAKVATDLAEMHFIAGADEAGTALLDEAAAWCAAIDHPLLRRAFGTVLQHRATALFIALPRTASTPDRAQQHLRDLTRTAQQAVLLRRQLRDPRDALSRYQLATSLVLLSTVTLMIGDPVASAEQLAEATRETAALRSRLPQPEVPVVEADVVELRTKTRRQAGLLERFAPQEAARHRAESAWPS